jgi:MFS family permease
MTFVPVMTGSGYLIGALAGWLYKLINRQLALTVFLAILALSVLLVPFYHAVWLLFAALVFNGIGDGAWDAGSSYWMVEMWPKGNAGMLQLMQFMYGCGSVVATLLVAPYVEGETTILHNRTITGEDRIRALSLPFAVTGCLQMIGQ